MRLIVAAFLIISFNALSQTDTVKLSSDIWPPFTNVENKRSIAFEIVAKALERINIKAVYEIVDFGDVISGINEGLFDGSAALWISEERKKILLFSDAYLQNQLVLVGRKGSAIDISSFSELKNKRIGVIEDYAYGDSLKIVEGIEIVYGKNDQRNLERLLSRQLDYILVDALLVQYLLKYQLSDVREFLEIGGHPLITKTLHLAIKKDIPDAERIIKLFNNEINSMILDGSYNEILELNWIRADIDGDNNFELVLLGSEAGLEAPGNAYNVFYTQPGNFSDRYFINGKFYNDWGDVPEQIKIPKVSAPPDPGKGELKIKF